MLTLSRPYNVYKTQIRATRLTPKGLLGVIFEIHDPYAGSAASFSSPRGGGGSRSEEERAYRQLAAEHADDGGERQVLVEIRRGKGDILAFRQFYHDFTKHHLPPLLPPLLHASATTSFFSAPGEEHQHQLDGEGVGSVGFAGPPPERVPSFSSVPGAK